MTVFRKFDINRDGVIEKAELAKVMARLDPGYWTSENTDAFFSAADLNGDSLIDYEELVKWMFAEGDLQEAIFAAAEQISYPIDDAVAQELTWARTKPAEVAEVLRAREGQYKGKDYFPPERSGGSIVTKEGWAVVEEAIEFLMEQAKDPIGGVGSQSEVGLALAGEDHIADIGQTGTASHASSDGTTSAERIRRYGKFSSFGECLWYGSELSTPRMMVLDLIVDDGVSSRGHRLGVYNGTYDIVGVAYGTHCTFGRMAALEFGRGWKPDSDAVTARISSGPVTPDAEVIAKAKASATTQWTLGTCPVCKEAIKGGRVVEIKDLGKVHADCFNCTSCSKALKGVPYRIHDGSLMCTECHAKMHGEKCTACGKPISGGMMKCSLGTFHIECLICSVCNTAIGKNKFSTSGGVMTCQSCAGSGGGVLGGPPGAKAKAGAKAKPGAKAGAGAKAKPKPKAKGKVSMTGAQNASMGIAMDYAALE
jgi:hypothetical protein